MFIILHDTSKSFMKPEYCYSEYYHDTSMQMNNSWHFKKKTTLWPLSMDGGQLPQG